MPEITRRTVLQWGIAAGVLGLAACGGDDVAPGTTSSAPSVPRAPAPTTVGGLKMLARQDGQRLLLQTRGGDLDFWAGVNLGSTTPGHMPGEVAISREDYRRWLPMMRDLGVRVLRIYTIHPPAFYEELRAFNLAHPDDPIYLIHGIYLPDESYIDTGDLYAEAPTKAMIAEVRDAVAAAHGTLKRTPAPGRASGTWTADVGPWLAAWLVGVEWDPSGTQRTNKAHAGMAPYAGRYFAATAQATPTESWIAARLDELAVLEAAAGVCVPLAIVNWPPADPLRHPLEPNPLEDLVGVDANHVLPTAAWPAGTFASYHAYPYYPDFQMLQYAGPDPYRDYLKDLQRHHSGMPLMITELGVPGSLGCAHRGGNNRDQGDHDEAEQMRMDAQLVSSVAELHLAGAILFAWADEWFKFTWNTLPRHSAALADRRALWHDPLTNEQWFGLIATDPTPVGRRVVHEAAGGIRSVALDHDASFVHLTVEADGSPQRVEFGFNILPGAGLRLPSGRGSALDDVAVSIDVPVGTATAVVRGDVDPLLLDGLQKQDVPAAGANGWALQRLALNRSYLIPGTTTRHEAEFMEIGRLRQGRWEPDAKDADSRATWRVEPAGERPWTLRLRLPWSMLLLADPSSLIAYAPKDGVAAPVPITSIAATVFADDASATFPIRWEGWNRASFTERPKRGIGDVRTVLRRHAG